MKINQLILFSILLLTGIGVVAQSYPFQQRIVFDGTNTGKTKTVALKLAEAGGVEVMDITSDYLLLSFETQQHLLSALNLAAVNTDQLKLRNGMPLDFPMMPTNPTPAEIEEYTIQKNLWIENNSERYGILQQPTDLVIIPLEEFDSMPDHKQEHILSRPDLYTVQ
jgi:hypothetical protein